MNETSGYDKRYWVVSPNVNNDETTVGDWRRASVLGQAAFMGWSPDDGDHKQMGPKFAGNTENGIKPGDVILIARRHNLEPEIVGFGEVVGKAVNRIPGLVIPDEIRDGFGSARKLKPFVSWSGSPPRPIPIREVIRHTTALAQLHPETNAEHKKVCDWMDQQLSTKPADPGDQKEGAPKTTIIVDSPEHHQLDYKVQTQARVLKAKKDEARLLEAYKEWLALQEREISAARYGRIQCDAYEADRKNLIEAKTSARREHVRMAVGQLLDYAYQGRKELGVVNKAILLPVEPPEDIKNWLESLDIRIIWREKNVFLDNANGQFT